MIASSIIVLTWVVVAAGITASVTVGIEAATAVAKVVFLLGGLILTAIGALMLLVASGVCLYATVGLACMFTGGNYLDYGSLDSVLPNDRAMARSHGILLVEIGVGITVMFSMLAIHINLASNGRFDRGL